MPRRKRRSKLHPILREIAKRQREIASLVRAAKLINLDLTPILPAHPNARKWPRKKASEYQREVSRLMQEPLSDDLPDALKGSAQ